MDRLSDEDARILALERRVAVVSAAGTLFFGLCADRPSVEGLDLIAAGIDNELAGLLEQARDASPRHPLKPRQMAISRGFRADRES